MCLLLVILLNASLVSQFSHQMCFSLVNFVHKITIKRDIGDAFAISIYSETIMTLLYTFKDQNCCLLIK